MTRPPRRLEPPESLPYLVQIRPFTDYHLSVDPALPPEKIDDMYKQYKLDYSFRATRTFFDASKDKAWFTERYSIAPQAKEERAARRAKANHKARAADWIAASSRTAPSFDAHDEEPATPPHPDSATEEQPEASSSTSADPSTIEYSLEAHDRTLFVNSTVASRKEIEEAVAKHAGFDYVALSEPLVAKNARSAWIVFSSAEAKEQAKEPLSATKVSLCRVTILPRRC